MVVLCVCSTRSYRVDSLLKLHCQSLRDPSAWAVCSLRWAAPIEMPLFIFGCVTEQNCSAACSV